MVAAAARLVHDRIGDRGIEHLADRIDPHQALLLEGGRAARWRSAPTSVAPWASAPSHASSTGSRRSTSAPERAGDLVVEPALGLLAEVVEVGRGALVGVAELVAREGDALEVGDERLHRHLGERAVVEVVEELALDDLVVTCSGP